MRTAEREQWPADQWGHILAPSLTGEAQRAYRDLTPHQAGHYLMLKRAILRPLWTQPPRPGSTLP